MKPEIYILGVGHNTALTIELAEACGYSVAGLYHFCEGRSGEIVCGVPILGTHEELLSAASLNGLNFALSMGDNQIRASLFRRIKEKGGCLPPLIHPTCIVSCFATIGEGTQLEAYCCVHANTHIKENCNLQPYALICHNSTVEEHSFIAAKAIVGAYMTLGQYAFVGMGAILISSKVKNVGHHCTIGAGSVVTKDIEAFSVVAGVPARKVKN